MLEQPHKKRQHTQPEKLVLLQFVINISSNLCVCEQPIRCQNLFVRWLLRSYRNNLFCSFKILKDLVLFCEEKCDYGANISQIICYAC